MKKFLCCYMFIILFFAGSVILPGSSAEAFSIDDIELVPDLPSGQPVGTVITWTANVTVSGTFYYRLVLARMDEPLRIMYDFSPKNTFEWAPIEDGTYKVIASVRDQGTGQIVHVQSLYEIVSRVSNEPVVTPTDNPLVALYSAPPCQEGNRMRVLFLRKGGYGISVTAPKPCRPDHSMNFYVAGMLQTSAYYMRHHVIDENGAIVEFGPLKIFATGPLGVDLPIREVLDPPEDQIQNVVLHAYISLGRTGIPTIPFATDLWGRIIWYVDPSLEPEGTILYRPVPGGTFLCAIGENGVKGQILREIDLAGRTVRETTASRIREQLVYSGQDPLWAVHHEARRLPNGHTAVIGSVERIVEDPHGSGLINIVGDYIVVLDENWQVDWTWNGFDHLDVSRGAVLGEMCYKDGPGCPPIMLADNATDWMHSNAIAYSPVDGSFLLSVRHQDWVIKIDYADGAGSGDIIWRLGPEGDFTIEATDPYPWFTHQHDPNYTDDNRIAIYDNGNTRCEYYPENCNSRGQVYSIDEKTMTATLDLNADLGNYAKAVGSAQQLLNGNFFFTSGLIFPEAPLVLPFATSDEVLPDGGITYTLKYGGVDYRSFRMIDLYRIDR